MKIYHGIVPSYRNGLSSSHTAVRTNGLVSVINDPQVVVSREMSIYICDDLAFPRLALNDLRYFKGF